MAILGKIENFDRNKSYTGFSQPDTKFIPVYGTQCSCNYGYKCDDPEFDSSKPIRYIEVPLSDPRTSTHD